jgi:ribosomal protein S12 methylthiotransferase accessory factor YcaO
VAVNCPEFQTENEAGKHFVFALKLEPLVRMFSHFFSRRRAASAAFNFLNRYAKQKNLVLGVKEIQSHGILIPKHCCVNVALRSSDSNSDVALVSGSGDAEDFDNAFFVAIFEALERLAYFRSKSSSQFSFAMDVRQGFRNTQGVRSASSSTGASIHNTPARALLSGILEIIERDAYLCHWYTARPPQQISPSHIKSYCYAACKAHELGVNLGVFLLSSAVPSVKVVLVTVYDPRQRFGNTGFCSGLAAAFSVEVAIVKALFELDRFVYLWHSLGVQATSVSLQRDHPMFRFYHYLQISNLSDLAVFLAQGSDVQENVSEDVNKGVAVDWKKLAELLHENGHDVYVQPLSVPKSLQTQMYCCQVVVPTLQKLDYEDEPNLNVARLAGFSSSGRIRNLIHPLP